MWTMKSHLLACRAAGPKDAGVQAAWRDPLHGRRPHSGQGGPLHPHRSATSLLLQLTTGVAIHSLGPLGIHVAASPQGPAQPPCKQSAAQLEVTPT